MNARRVSCREHDGDRGGVLIMVLVFMIIGTMFVIPTLKYAITVSHNNRVLDDKVVRLEAVKGGLRTALADPKQLFAACSGEVAGLHRSVALAPPDLEMPVKTECFNIKQNTAFEGTNLRVGVAAVQVGAVPPSGSTNTYSGRAPENVWQSAATPVSTGGKIWLPQLPKRAVVPRPSTPFPMEDADCLVYAPGTYSDSILITGTTPVYFLSGIYYFEKEVHISGANVVIGEGTVEGCGGIDQEVMGDRGLPNITTRSGNGATFVFGKTGRLVIDDAAGPTSVVFNKRYAQASMPGTLVSEDISIESVNGVVGDSPLSIPGVISVPASVVNDGSSTSPLSADTAPDAYSPSTLVPSADGSVTPVPVVEVNATTSTNSLKVAIPGYVAVPQGRVRVSVASAEAAANKDVQLTGGVLAASFDVGLAPATYKLDLKYRVTQNVLKIVTQTTSGSPKLTSEAVVQVNENGDYAINSWSIS